MLRHLFRWTRRGLDKAIRGAQAPKRRQSLPSLECLETRDLLATAHPFHIITHNGAAPFSSAGPMGYTPSQVRHAYGFDQISYRQGGVSVPGDGRGETI